MLAPQAMISLRMAELFGLGAVAEAQCLGKAGAAGGRADGPVEARGAQAMKEAAIHARAVEQSHGAGVAVRQNGFGPELVRDGRKPAGDGVERIIPGDAFEASFALRARTPLRIEQAGGRIFALQILRHFAAQESAGNRMGGVAAQFEATAIFDRHQQGTAIRAIEGAYRTADFRH